MTLLDDIAWHGKEKEALSMKKLFVILCTLFLILCAVPAVAEMGTADVIMEGETYHLTLQSVDIVDGKLTVAIEGFGNTLRWGANGPMVAALPEARYGGEAVKVSTVNMNVGAAFTFVFERDDLPDEIWMNSYDEGVDPVLIWQSGEAETQKEAASASVPEELVGKWHGTGTPKGGGPAIDLAARIDADGSGEYTFIQDDYTESYPFTISSDDSSFSVDIPADNYLGIARCEGTWALEDGVLKLDITTTFAYGGSYSYTAECEKAAEAPESGGSILPGMIREGRSSSGYEMAQTLAERYGTGLSAGYPVYTPADPQPLNVFLVTRDDCEVGINRDGMYKVSEKGLVDSITRYLKEWIGEIEEESGGAIRFVKDPDRADVLISACQKYSFYGTYGQGTYRCSAYSSTVILQAVQLSHPENYTTFRLTNNPGKTITTNGGSKWWKYPPELENTTELAGFVDSILGWYGWDLKSGSQGEKVAVLQQALIARGALSGDASGIYDAQTEDAVKALQTACGLNPTGRIDAATLIAVYYGQQEVDALPEDVRLGERR